MATDKGAWIGSGVFALLMVVMVLRPAAPPFRNRQKTGPVWARPLVTRDLDRIREDTLRVLVLRDPLTWEERPGAVVGLEWELLKRFAKHEKLRLEAVPVDHPDSMLLYLQDGRGDLVAAQLCPDGPTKRFISFSVPYRHVAPLRAQLNSDPLIRSTWKKKGKKGDPGIASDTLVVSCWSPFLGIASAIDSSFGAIRLLVDSVLPEDLLVRSAIGATGSVLVTDAIGTLEARRMPQVAFGPRLGRSVPLAFGMRTNAPQLRDAIDKHLSSASEQEAIDNLVLSYTNGQLTKGALRRMPELTLNGDSLSPFDSLFQVHADANPYDWTLLAAVAYKESRFDSAAGSFAGAQGLMQMMPATAAAMGVDTSDGVSGHVKGASSYLAEMEAIWRKSVPDHEQRMKFTLASYNAGAGHIKDAQRLAEELGLDPRRWDGHVERALLLLSKPRFFTRPEIKNGYCRGHETFWYVRDVVSTFAQFERSGKR